MNTAQRDEGRKEVGDELGKYIRNADQALYHAKKSGRDNTVEYTSELDQYNLQNYFAQKLNIFKKRLQSFLSIAAPVGMKQDASMQSTEIRQIFTRKSTKTILPLRNSTRNKAD